MADDTPPLPAGYTLSESTPPLPPGYKLAGDSTPPAQDTGVMASLKRTGSNLIHLPGAVYDAFTKPAQNPAEQAISSAPVGGQNLPPSIALGLHRLIVAPMVAEADKAKQMRADAKTQTPEQANNPYNGTEHLANMHQLASIFPVLGPVAADITQRYLTGDKSGAVTDLAANVAGPKIAEGAVNGAARTVAKIAPDVAERMYSSALKPSTTIPADQRAAIVRTGIDNAIPVSQKGAETLSNLISDYSDKVKAMIQGGAAKGATIDPRAVAARADQVNSRFATQVNPESDLSAIQASKDEFLRNQHVPPAGASGPVPGIPVDEAQAMKQGTYQQLKGRAYGELKSATVEAQKALARGIKEELETQFPEIKGLNAQQAKFMDIDGVLERSLNRIGNHQLIGIGTPIAAGAAGAVVGHPGAAAMAAGGLKAILDNPMFKSRLAISISKGGNIPPAIANAKVNQFFNALAQSQGGPGASEPGIPQ